MPCDQAEPVLKNLRGLRALRAQREAADYELRSKPLAWSVVHAQVGLSRELIQRHIKALPETEFSTLEVRRT